MKKFILLTIVLAVSACSTSNTTGIEASSELYNKAEENFTNKNYTSAKDNWKKLLDEYPNSKYAQLADLKIADIEYNLENYQNAILSYNQFIRIHQNHQQVPYAYLQIANSNFNQYKGVKRDQTTLKVAHDGYKNIVAQYPNTEEAKLAKEKITECRELLAEYELLVAKFYIKRGMTEPAQKRLKRLVKEYPETKAAVEARKM